MLLHWSCRKFNSKISVGIQNLKKKLNFFLHGMSVFCGVAVNAITKTVGLTEIKATKQKTSFRARPSRAMLGLHYFWSSKDSSARSISTAGRVKLGATPRKLGPSRKAWVLYPARVAELDEAAYARVQLGEELAPPTHVVADAGVQEPSRVLVTGLLLRCSIGSLLVEEDVLEGWCARTYLYGERVQACDQQCLLLFLSFMLEKTEHIFYGFSRFFLSMLEKTSSNIF